MIGICLTIVPGRLIVNICLVEALSAGYNWGRWVRMLLTKAVTSPKAIGEGRKRDVESFCKLIIIPTTRSERTSTGE